MYQPKHAGDAVPASSWLQPAALGRHARKKNLIDRILEALVGPDTEFVTVQFP